MNTSLLDIEDIVKRAENDPKAHESLGDEDMYNLILDEIDQMVAVKSLEAEQGERLKKLNGMVLVTAHDSIRKTLGKLGRPLR